MFLFFQYNISQKFFTTRVNKVVLATFCFSARLPQQSESDPKVIKRLLRLETCTARDPCVLSAGALEQPRRLGPLRTCTRPIRVGLSKRAKARRLHHPHPYKWPPEVQVVKSSMVMSRPIGSSLLSIVRLLVSAAFFSWFWLLLFLVCDSFHPHHWCHVISIITFTHLFASCHGRCSSNLSLLPCLYASWWLWLMKETAVALPESHLLITVHALCISVLPANKCAVLKCVILSAYDDVFVLSSTYPSNLWTEGNYNRLSGCVAVYPIFSLRPISLNVSDCRCLVPPCW